MKRLIAPVVMMLAVSMASSARATMVLVDNLQLGSGGPAMFDPVSVAPSALMTFTGVTSGAYTLDITLKIDPGPGGAVAQTAAGVGISPGGGGLLDPGQFVVFSVASATVTAGPMPFVTFDGFTDFEPNNPALADLSPSPSPGTPEPVVTIENVGATSFGVALASLKFTAVPEPSAFMYGGLIASIAGIGYRGRRWFAGSQAEE